LKQSIFIKIGIALLLTCVFLSIRLALLLNNPVMSNELNITYGGIALRACFMVTYIYITFSYTLWARNQSSLRVFLSNLGITFLFAFSLLIILRFNKGVFFEARREFFSSFFSYLVLFGVVQLIVAFVQANQKKLEVSISKERLEKEKISIELNSLKAQLNPHFLFNALNTLNGLIRIDPNQAIEYNEQLSSIFRYIVHHRNTALASIQDELEFIKQYVALVKTRYGEHLKMSIHIPDEALRHKIPCLSLQLLVENAIKHNEVSLSHPLEIVISLDKGALIIANPKKQKKQALKSIGLGLDNLNQRSLLLQNQPIRIEQTEDIFKVVVPTTS